MPDPRMDKDLDESNSLIWVPLEEASYQIHVLVTQSRLEFNITFQDGTRIGFLITRLFYSERLTVVHYLIQ